MQLTQHEVRHTKCNFLNQHQIICYFVLLSTESSGYRLSGVYCYSLRLNDGSKSEEGVFIRTAFVYGELFLAHSGRLVGFRSGNETLRGKARKRSLNAAASKRWLKGVLPNIFINLISMKSHGFVRREGKDQVAIKRELIHFISFHPSPLLKLSIRSPPPSRTPTPLPRRLPCRPTLPSRPLLLQLLRSFLSNHQLYQNVRWDENVP